MYAIVIGVSSKILALPDFFFDPVMFGNTFVPHNYANSVFLLPLPPPCQPPTLSSRAVNPSEVGPYPTSHAPPAPNSRHPLSARNPLLCFLLPLHVTCVHRQVSRWE